MVIIKPGSAFCAVRLLKADFFWLLIHPDSSFRLFAVVAAFLFSGEVHALNRGCRTYNTGKILFP
jgi:hypothetical protein